MAGMADIASFRFRDLQPKVVIGTASDRYAGWIGQIYNEESYKGRLSRRSKKLGGKTFVEAVLPVVSVQEYFRHFGILELDFTFYDLLRDKKGEPTRTFHLLHTYSQHLHPGDRLILKAPQVIFARNVYRRGNYVENEHYLDPKTFIKQFYEPAVELSGPWLDAIVFEQEYQRKRDRVSLKEAAAGLGAFFRAIPADDRYHVELRTEAFLSGPVFDVLERQGVGQVLSHWTWLPTLSKQFSLSKMRFLNRKGSVIRLMTPRGMRYEEAYARAHPFNSLISGMQSAGMVRDTTQLIWAAIAAGIRMNIIINNRAGGNAPLIAQQIAERFLGART
ncbi:MAG: DUF72 domain-containing protein [Deltaproteobacteria bacterium]|nr:DUF72 domain-containing protein [Deltaproteobacteria bacterium]